VIALSAANAPPLTQRIAAEIAPGARRAQPMSLRIDISAMMPRPFAEKKGPNKDAGAERYFLMAGLDLEAERAAAARSDCRRPPGPAFAPAP
jgi:hypothetical protein